MGRRGGPFSIDGVVAVLACAVAELELALSHNIDGPRWVNAVGAAAITLPIAVRRTCPLLVAPFMIGVLVLQEIANGDVVENSITPVVTVPLAVYSLAAILDRRRALIGFALSIALIWTVVLISMDRALDDFVFTAILVGGPFLVGRIVNARVQLARELREKAARLEREQGERERLAVAEERARIAREMHDVLTHNVSVMVVQASAAKRMVDHDPARAREALTSVEETGREALAEMRRTLGVLRDEGEQAALSPQPSMDELDALLDRARARGLDVALEVEGERRRVQSSVALSCFRIVQEALTNTIEHADADHARVRVRYTPGEVEIDISDDGRGSRPAALNGTGQGLVGMRERVAMLGGRLETGYRAGGGFEVRATLPLAPEDR